MSRALYPIGPFRKWLNADLEKHARMYDMSQNDYAEMLGIDNRRIYRWLHDGQCVSLAAVDRVLTLRGETGLLNELCPPDAEFRRSPPTPVKCHHGDTERSPKTGRCKTCHREAQRRSRDRAEAA